MNTREKLTKLDQKYQLFLDQFIKWLDWEIIGNNHFSRELKKVRKVVFSHNDILQIISKYKQFI